MQLQFRFIKFSQLVLAPLESMKLNRLKFLHSFINPSSGENEEHEENKIVKQTANANNKTKDNAKWCLMRRLFFFTFQLA